MNRAVAAAVALAALLAGANAARADIDGTTFSRAMWGWRVSLTGPKNWVLSEDQSYPSVWLWMVRRDPPGKMLLSAERLDGHIDALTYAKKSSELLETLGFAIRQPQLHSQTGAYWLDLDNGKVYLRQAFLVIGDVGYALTLAADTSRNRGNHLRAFDGALRSIKIKRAPADGDAAAADAGPP